KTPWQQVRRAIKELVRDGSRRLVESGVRRDDVRVELAVDVRHRGQGEPVTVELGPGLASDPERQVEEAFEKAYVALYGRRPPGVEAEIVTWRVRVFGPTPELSVEASGESGGEAGKGSRPVWFAETGIVQTNLLDRYRLRPGSD